MFKVVERKVVKTEVENVAVFTCDMCGESSSTHTEGYPEGFCAWAGLEDKRIDLCSSCDCLVREMVEHVVANGPSCAEKVREFIEGNGIPKVKSIDPKDILISEYRKIRRELSDRVETLERDNENLEIGIEDLICFSDCVMDEINKLEKERDELEERVKSLKASSSDCESLFSYLNKAQSADSYKEKEYFRKKASVLVEKIAQRDDFDLGSKLTTRDYLAGHKACGIKEGDEVRVVRKAKDFEQGWGQRWSNRADRLVENGEPVKIEKDANGAGFRVDLSYSYSAYLPWFVLEVVAPKSTSYEEACAGLKPKDWVLARMSSDYVWSLAIYSHKGDKLHCTCGGGIAPHCLPYEPYKHLLGTDKSPWEE